MAFFILCIPHPKKATPHGHIGKHAQHACQGSRDHHDERVPVANMRQLVRQNACEFFSIE